MLENWRGVAMMTESYVFTCEAGSNNDSSGTDVPALTV